MTSTSRLLISCCHQYRWFVLAATTARGKRGERQSKTSWKKTAKSDVLKTQRIIKVITIHLDRCIIVCTTCPHHFWQIQCVMQNDISKPHFCGKVRASPKCQHRSVGVNGVWSGVCGFTFLCVKNTWSTTVNIYRIAASSALWVYSGVSDIKMVQGLPKHPCPCGWILDTKNLHGDSDSGMILLPSQPLSSAGDRQVPS